MKFFNSKYFLVFISILLALVLYFNASSPQVRENTASTEGQVYSTTLDDLPIDLQYDENKYFISGYEARASAVVSSYNQVRITQEEDPSLRSISLSVDLSKLVPGTYAVPIKVDGLDQGISAKVNPASTQVVVENRASKTFDVTPVIDPSLFPEGFELDSVSVDVKQVLVTAGKESIHKISKVEAILPPNVDLSKDFTGTVALIAVNDSGQPLPGILSKKEARLNVKVKLIEKKTE